MSDRRWSQMRDVFGEALQRPPDERAAFVADACGDDAELRSEVEALLESDTTADGFLEPPLIDNPGKPPSAPLMPGRFAAAEPEAAGFQIEGYRIRRQI
ncbi:MAG: hypothetical protein ACE5EC_03940, partial [Phycisphaerae bacterium]